MYIEEILVPGGTHILTRAAFPCGDHHIGRVILSSSIRMIEDSAFDYLTIDELVLADGPCCIKGDGILSDSPMECEVDLVVIPSNALMLPFGKEPNDIEAEYILDRSSTYDAQEGQLPPADEVEAGIRNFVSFLQDIVQDAITVDPAHPLLRSVDGVLYDKSLKTLYFVPQTKRRLTLPSSLQRVAKRAVVCPELSYIRLPEGTLVLEEYAISPFYADGLTRLLEIPWSLTDNRMFFEDTSVLFHTPYGDLKIRYPFSFARFLKFDD